MTATAQQDEEIAMQRLMDEPNTRKCIYEFVRRILMLDNQKLPEDGRLSSMDVGTVLVSRSSIEDALDEAEYREGTRRVLDALDIPEVCFDRLPEILDAQNSGSILLVSLVEGLERLRGKPQRSDIVTIDLTLRALQKTIDEMREHVYGDIYQSTMRRARAQNFSTRA